MSREQRLRERLSLALRSAMPEYAALAAWQAYVARKTGLKPSKVRDHMNATHKCVLADFLAYCDYFGPEFERDVRGPEQSQP